MCVRHKHTTGKMSGLETTQVVYDQHFIFGATGRRGSLEQRITDQQAAEGRGGGELEKTLNLIAATLSAY